MPRCDCQRTGDLDGFFPAGKSLSIGRAYLYGALYAVGAVTALMIPALSMDLYRAVVRPWITGQPATPLAQQEVAPGGTVLPGPL